MEWTHKQRNSDFSGFADLTRSYAPLLGEASPGPFSRKQGASPPGPLSRKRRGGEKKASLLLGRGLLLSLLTLLILQPAVADTTPPPMDSPQFPLYVMNKIDDQYRGGKSHGVMSMSVKTAHFERTITLESWTLGKDYSLMRILKPLKERGTATLKAKNDLYTYLNKTNRTIKITSAMMGGSWMGSHFTNDDLVRHTRLARDFVITLDKASMKPESQSYTFTLIPKKDAVVVWGKQVVTVRKSDLQPLEQTYFDEKMKPVRQLTFSDHQTVDGRTMPMKMVMKPLDGSNEYTMVTWKEIDFSVSLNPGFFSIQKLKSL